MRHIHQEVRVEAPINRVFELACEVDRQAEWNPYMEIRNVSGPIDTRGTTFDSTLRLIGLQVKSHSTIVEAERPRLIHIRGVADNGSVSDWTYGFEPVAEATRCTLDVEYEPTGALESIVDIVVYHHALERAIRHMAENFAAVAEAKVPQAV